MNNNDFLLPGSDSPIISNINDRNTNRNYNEKYNSTSMFTPTPTKKRKYNASYSSSSTHKTKPKKEELISEESKEERKGNCKLAIAKVVADMVNQRIGNGKNVKIENDIDFDSIEDDVKLHVSKKFIFGLTEVIFDTAKLLATDLELFRKHRNKKAVAVEDVMLFVRRNPSLKQKLKDHYGQIISENM